MSRFWGPFLGIFCYFTNVYLCWMIKMTPKSEFSTLFFITYQISSTSSTYNQRYGPLSGQNWPASKKNVPSNKKNVKVVFPHTLENAYNGECMVQVWWRRGGALGSQKSVKNGPTLFSLTYDWGLLGIST